jgi:hypothetical protein
MSRSPGHAALRFTLSLLVLPGCGESQSGLGGDDQDGIVGGDAPFEVTVNDDAFLPTAIWKTQNLANVTLTLKNEGTRSHGFSIRCLGDKCFPSASTIGLLDPGTQATTKFQVPYAEGIFDVDDGTAAGPTGQFIVQ